MCSVVHVYVVLHAYVISLFHSLVSGFSVLFLDTCDDLWGLSQVVWLCCTICVQGIRLEIGRCLTGWISQGNWPIDARQTWNVCEVYYSILGERSHPVTMHSFVNESLAFISAE